MKLALLLSIVICSQLIFSNTKIYAQQPTTIVLEYRLDKVLKDSFFFHIMKPWQAETFGESFLYKDKLVSYHETDSICRVVSELMVYDTTCAFTFELFGHEIVLIPGDTIYIKAIPKKNQSKSTTEFPSRDPGMYQLAYSGANKFFYEYSDSLALVGGDVRLDHIPFKKTDSLSAFFDKATKYYNLRLGFLQDYSARHNLPEIFTRLMRSEIHSAYVINICLPMETSVITVTKYPEAILHVLDGSTINSEYYYSKTALYADYVLAIIKYRALKNTNSGKHANILVENYELIKQTISEEFRDHLLTNFLSKYAYTQPEPFDSLYNDYQSVCKSEAYKADLSELVKKNLVKLKKSKSLTIHDALASSVLDTKQHVFSIGSTLKNNKPTVIDCWATWCAPCMKELPDEKKFQTKYGKLVNFINLSFDRNEKQWKTGPAKLLSSQNYFLIDAFRSDFANYFKMNSIPRYLVFDKRGNLLSDNAIRPAMTKEFTKMIEKLL